MANGEGQERKGCEVGKGAFGETFGVRSFLQQNYRCDSEIFLVDGECV